MKQNLKKRLNSENPDDFLEAYNELKELYNEFEKGDLQNLQNTNPYFQIKQLITEYQPKYLLMF